MKSKIKKIINKKGFRISNEVLDKIIQKINEKSLEIVEKTIRNAMLSGRKTIREEDVED
ncbi:MAG: NFYB/HAP3 family transcription factor subunit [Candidatus Pacearchaeota archaeon]